MGWRRVQVAQTVRNAHRVLRIGLWVDSQLEGVDSSPVRHARFKPWIWRRERLDEGLEAFVLRAYLLGGVLDEHRVCHRGNAYLSRLGRVQSFPSTG